MLVLFYLPGMLSCNTKTPASCAGTGAVRGKKDQKTRPAFAALPLLLFKKGIIKRRSFSAFLWVLKISIFTRLFSLPDHGPRLFSSGRGFPLRTFGPAPWLREWKRKPCFLSVSFEPCCASPILHAFLALSMAADLSLIHI